MANGRCYCHPQEEAHAQQRPLITRCRSGRVAVRVTQLLRKRLATVVFMPSYLLSALHLIFSVHLLRMQLDSANISFFMELKQMIFSLCETLTEDGYTLKQSKL